MNLINRLGFTRYSDYWLYKQSSVLTMSTEDEKANNHSNNGYIGT